MAWRNIAAHPRRRTFTELVLAPDVVGPELEALERRIEAAPAPRVAVRVAPGVLRRDQAELAPAEQTAFKNAVARLVQDGTYRTLVGHHMDMSHNMHGSMGATGLYRFLPWHRRYLVEFERALIAADRTLRPQTQTPLTVPYWRWSDPFPGWLNGLLPAPDPDTGAAAPPRTLAAPPPKPTAADITIILDGFKDQLPGRNVSDYVRFTYGLEGWGQRPDGSSLPAHNHVHDWVGGIMSNTATSPTDPVFWLHHAQVDRLWHIWQMRHPGEQPPLTGSDRVMDPWTETFEELADITALGYSYANDMP